MTLAALKSSRQYRRFFWGDGGEAHVIPPTPTESNTPHPFTQTSVLSPRSSPEASGLPPLVPAPEIPNSPHTALSHTNAWHIKDSLEQNVRALQHCLEPVGEGASAYLDTKVRTAIDKIK